MLLVPVQESHFGKQDFMRVRNYQCDPETLRISGLQIFGSHALSMKTPEYYCTDISHTKQKF